ncbi:response regulator, partial [Methylobacterium hispanicum]
PAAFVHEAPAALAVPEAANANEDIEAAGLVLRGTVLLVEDNMIIALEGEEMLLGLGARAVETAASVRDALRIVETRDPDFALLDMNLGTETSLPVAERLRERGTPFAFATGYGEQLRLPDGLRHVPVVRKPYDAQALRRAFGH